MQIDWAKLCCTPLHSQWGEVLSGRHSYFFHAHIFLKINEFHCFGEQNSEFAGWKKECFYKNDFIPLCDSWLTIRRIMGSLIIWRLITPIKAHFMFGISSFSGFIQLYFNVPSSISLIVLFNMVPYPYTTRLASAFTIKEVKKTIPSQYSLKKGICFRVLGHKWYHFWRKNNNYRNSNFICFSDQNFIHKVRVF